ncbi:MAG: TPM domain-containing protein [Thermoanaerobaculia bacterium]
MTTSLARRQLRLRPRLFTFGRAWAWLVFLLAFAGGAATGFAAGAVPEKPARWVSDRAGVLSAGAAAAIDGKLEAFERAQGSQVLIAIFPNLPENEALEEYTQRVAEAWRVGRARQDDGVVLFLFVADRALRLEVGYGLEGALTDLESKQILQNTLIPYLRNGDYDGGFTAAADAILVAIQGEYTADAQAATRPNAKGGGFVFFLVIIVLLILISAARNRGGRGSNWTGGSGGFGGGGFGGGGFGGGSFGGGGGFSGGGGSFGGGGASARW